MSQDTQIKLGDLVNRKKNTNGEETFNNGEKNSNDMSNYPKELDPLTEARGVGPSALSNFEEVGLTSPEEIGKLSAREIEDKVSGVGYTTAVSILENLERKGYRERDIEEENLNELISLLKELFEFDHDERDFGVYKLMNKKREEIEKFINKELINRIEEETEDVGENESDELRELRETLEGLDIVGPDGEVIKDVDLDKVKKYKKLRASNNDNIRSRNVKAEIYNHIYKFFDRYYDSGDFITRRYRTNKESKFSVPYNGDETHFHWVTKGQYYAKSSENFTRFSFNHMGYKYKFITENTKMEKDVEVDDEYFVMQEPEKITVEEETKEIIIVFERRGLTEEDLKRADISSRTHDKQKSLVEKFSEELSQFLSTEGINFRKDEIENKVNEYTERNTSDFFIHKKLKQFLEYELDEYIKTEVLKVNKQNGYSISDINQTQANIISEISMDIISFLSSIEEFKKKIFEKKKFVKESYNLVPVGEIDEDYHKTILENNKQLEKWEESFNIEKEELNPELLGKEPYNRMMVNTKLYEEDLVEEQPENKLIKGENYQALNFLKEKYKNSVKCIYIDPPYNTGSANFAYKDNYQRSSWLSMIYDRIKLAKKVLTDDGIIFVHIDANEFSRLETVLNSIFGEDNKVAELVWELKHGENKATTVKRSHEYILAYAKKKSELEAFNPDGLELFEPDDDYTRDYAIKPISNMNPPSVVEIPEGTRFEGETETFEGNLGGALEVRIKSEEMVFEGGELADDVKLECGWSVKNQLEDWIENGVAYDEKGQEIVEFYFNSNGIPKYKKKQTRIAPDSVLSGFKSTRAGRRELEKIVGESKVHMNYTKPAQLIRHLIGLVVSDNDTVLDFFAGSGTTAQAVQELNRERDDEINYVLVELLDEAFDITEERIRRVGFSDEWDDGEPQVEDSTTLDSFSEEDVDLPGGVQCLCLESYEEALDAIEFEDEQSSLLDYKEYIINYMLEFETGNSDALLNTDRLINPSQYELNLDSQENITVDIMETFSYIIGMNNVVIEKREVSGVDYTLYKGEVDDESTLVIWRHSEEVDFEKEREAFNSKKFERIYVNGDSAIEGAKLVQPTFKNKMFQGDN